MKIASYHAMPDGRKSPSHPRLQERLTFEGFKQVHGGGLAELPPGYDAPPAGYSPRKTKHGEYMAVRDEG
jgi:hypothetical protein